MTDALDLAPATWIWDTRLPGHHAWLRAEHDVVLDAARATGSILLITASTQYELRVNGRIAFRGPAKSARGRVSVDRVPLDGLLRPGANRLAITVHHVGVPTMTWCQAKPGLIFRIDAADGTVLTASGPATRVAPDPAHARGTVRRWSMPCIEDLDLTAGAPAWAAPAIVDPGLLPYARRVPPPSRRRRVPVRVVAAQTVVPPPLVLSQRLKPYLVDGPELGRFNHFATAALLVAEIDSPVAQELRFLPAMGGVSWFLDGKLLFNGSGWGFDAMVGLPSVTIPAGRSRLVGLNRNSHFEDITLALRPSLAPVTVRNPYGAGWLQVVRLPGERSPETPAGLDPDTLRHAMPVMDPADGGADRNAFVRVMDADVVAVVAPTGDPAGELTLPAAAAGRASRLILDFGWVMNGHLAIELASAAPGRLTAAWTEHAVADGQGGVRLQWPNCNNALTIRIAAGSQAVEGFQAHGGRHLILDWEGAAPLRVSGVAMLDANCGSVEAGDLATDRPLHADIWDICRQSVISGVDDTFTDCPTFEQVGWNFDNHTAWTGERWLCANQAVAANSMRLFAEDPLLPGLVRSQYPSDWDNFIPMWSFHWILWVRDWWFHSADHAAARTLMARVAAGLDEALGRCRTDGLMAWEGVWHFVEWGEGRDDGHAINAAEQAGLWAALQAGEELAAGLGVMPEAAARWRAARLRLGEAVERTLWLPQRGAWADSLHADGTPSPVSSQVSNAWLAACGLGGLERAKDIARRIVARDPALIAYGSPLGLYRILELLCRSGQYAEALAIIERRWGEMLADGDRTVWETFPEFGLANGGWATRSRCHPFAAYAADMLVRILFGLEIVEPGCRRIRLRTPVAQAGGRGRASLPTPLGLLKLAWERAADGTCTWSIQAPAGMAVERAG